MSQDQTPQHVRFLTEQDRKRTHDHKNAISCIRTFVSLIENGYDFETATGRRILKQLSEISDYLEQELKELSQKQVSDKEP